MKQNTEESEVQSTRNLILFFKLIRGTKEVRD